MAVVLFLPNGLNIYGFTHPLCARTRMWSSDLVSSATRFGKGCSSATYSTLSHDLILHCTPKLFFFQHFWFL